MEKLKKKIQLINSFVCNISNLTLNISDDNPDLIYIMGDVTPKIGNEFKMPMEAVLTITKGLFKNENKICPLDTGSTFEFAVPYEELVKALSMTIIAKSKTNKQKKEQDLRKEENNSNYWQRRTNELKTRLKIESKNKANKFVILAIIFYMITIPLLFLWYIYPFFKNKKVVALVVGIMILIAGISNKEDANDAKNTASQTYKAPIEKGAYDILPTEFGKGYDKTIKKHGVANIKKSNELLPKAAEIVSKNKTCDKITWVMLSDNQSTKDNLVIIVDCANHNRFYLSEKEIEQKAGALSESQKLEGLMSTHINMCEAKIKENLNYPSTYKKLISKTGWETKTYINDIVIGFKAKNAFNLETEYTARCMINSKNQFSTFDIKEKR